MLHWTPPQYRHAARVSRYTVQPPRFGVAPITAKRDVIHKTGSTLRIATPPAEHRATATWDLHTEFSRDLLYFSRWNVGVATAEDGSSPTRTGVYKNNCIRHQNAFRVNKGASAPTSYQAWAALP